MTAFMLWSDDGRSAGTLWPTNPSDAHASRILPGGVCRYLRDPSYVYGLDRTRRAKCHVEHAPPSREGAATSDVSPAFRARRGLKGQRRQGGSYDEAFSVTGCLTSQRRIEAPVHDPKRPRLLMPNALH